jgi:hypothetical protein
VQREAGRAVDDLLLDWPFERPWDGVVRAVEGCAGARLHGLRHIANVTGGHDADLLVHLVRRPDRAVETLVDTLPGLLLADWAAVSDRRWPREPVFSSVDAPAPLPVTPPALPRPRSLVADGIPLMVLPCGDELRLLVGRSDSPGFTRTELDRCAGLLAAAVAVAGLAYRGPQVAAPSGVTARVVDADATVEVG